MTVGVPGNVPYIITVGAVTDSYTPYDTSDDRLASFSAAGPTVEGFVKPELLAPGGHMLGQMPPYAWLPLQYPEYVQPVDDYFTMSGTSQSAAVVSGVLALMLQADPGLAPDEAKCRLMASAKTGQLADGSHTYSVFQQGAGLVDAHAAVNETAVDCANRGMNIDLDLAGDEHYAGLAGVDENGTYYLVDGTGTRLTGPGFEWMQGLLWPEGSFWQRGPVTYTGAMWNQGEAWNPASSPTNTDSLLSQGILWPEGLLWPEGPLKASVSTSVWVDQE
jgi:subtilisin family serine protease